MIADALLQRTGEAYAYRSYTTDAESDDAQAEFNDTVAPLQSTINWILNQQSLAGFPHNAKSLQNLLARHGIEFDKLTDFWGNSYRTKFDVRGVGTVAEAVTVTGSAAEVVNTSMAAATTVQQVTLRVPHRQRANQATPPRLRQDFPETLVWHPSLITDAEGRVELKFNVADSITTWRMAVIGSTEDGLIGTATAGLRAFYPFISTSDLPPAFTIFHPVCYIARLLKTPNRCQMLEIRFCKLFTDL